MVLDDYLVEAYADDLQALEEAYKGKTKPLLELEKMIGENRKKYYSTIKVGRGYYSDSDFEKIGDKIAKIFGFKYCDFNLVNDPAPNAFTIPCGFSYQNIAKDKKVLMDKDNIKFESKSMSTVIRVTSGMWANKVFTDAEVTAIIIHEIGHNFQGQVNNFLRAYGVFMTYMNLYTGIINIIGGNVAGGIYSLVQSDSEARSEMNKWAKGSRSLKQIIAGFSSVYGFVRWITQEVVELAGRLTLGVPAGLLKIGQIIIAGASNPIDALIGLILTPVRKGAENVADDFAAEHGYGAELITALSKIDLDPDASATFVGRVSKKLPLFDSVCTLFALPTMIVSSLFTDHPVTPKRASAIVADLRKELNKSDVSPKVKKEIEAQIEEVEEAIKNMSQANGAIEGVALRKALYRFQTNFDKDPRRFIQKAASKKNLVEAWELLTEDKFITTNESYDLNELYDDIEESNQITMDTVMESNYDDLFR